MPVVHDDFGTRIFFDKNQVFAIGTLEGGKGIPRRDKRAFPNTGPEFVF
jgi:hypothetical protein